MTTPLNKINLATAKIDETELKKTLHKVTNKEVTVGGRVWKELKDGANLLIRSVKDADWVFHDPKVNDKFKTRMGELKGNIENLQAALTTAREQARLIEKNNTQDPANHLDFLKTENTLINVVMHQCVKIQHLLSQFSQNKLNEDNKKVLSDLEDVFKKEVGNCLKEVNKNEIEIKQEETRLLHEKIKEDYANFPKEIKTAINELRNKIEISIPKAGQVNKKAEENVIAAHIAAKIVQEIDKLLDRLLESNFTEPSQIKKSLDELNTIVESPELNLFIFTKQSGIFNPFAPLKPEQKALNSLMQKYKEFEKLHKEKTKLGL